MQKRGELFGVDLRSLATFRIGLGALLLIDLSVRATDLTAHYTDAGILPRAALIEKFLSPWDVSVHLANGTAAFQAGLLLLAGLFALALLVGYRTRLATIMSWALLMSLQVRNPSILSHADHLMRLLLFWGMFVPLGARYSFDNRSSPGLPQRVVSMGTLALLMQVVFVYEFTWLEKWGTEWWPEGSALYYTLSMDQVVTQAGRALLTLPPEWLRALTYFTYGFELLGPYLLFIPVRTGPIRTAVVCGFWCLQAGFGLCLQLGLFPWISCVAMLPFVPAWCWDHLLARVRVGVGWDRRFMRGVTRFMTLVGIPMRTTPVELGLSRRGTVFAAFCLVYVFCWNLGSVLHWTNAAGPLASVRGVGRLLKLDQQWKMFAPFPLKKDGWYVIPGTLKSGRQVDLFRSGQPVEWEKPPLPSAMYKNWHWHTYFSYIWIKGTYGYLPYLADYLCRNWNNRTAGQEQLEELEVIFMMEETLPERQHSEARPVPLWHYRCVAEPPTIGG